MEGEVPSIREIREEDRGVWAYSGAQAKFLIDLRLKGKYPGVPIFLGDCTMREVWPRSSPS